MFSKRCFSGWCVRRVVRICKGRKHQNASKHWCLQAFFVPLKGFSSVANRGEESEKHRLENTVWNPLGYGNATLLCILLHEMAGLSRLADWHEGVVFTIMDSEALDTILHKRLRDARWYQHISPIDFQSHRRILNEVMPANITCMLRVQSSKHVLGVQKLTQSGLNGVSERDF